MCRENFSLRISRKKLPFLRSRALDLWVQKQLYLRIGTTGYPYQILNKHGEGINKVESSEISKNILADLCYIFHVHCHIIMCPFTLTFRLKECRVRQCSLLTLNRAGVGTGGVGLLSTAGVARAAGITSREGFKMAAAS